MDKVIKMCIIHDLKELREEIVQKILRIEVLVLNENTEL